MPASNETNLRNFIGEWGKSFEAAEASFRDYLAPDVVWEQVGFVTTHTRDDAVALLHQMLDTYGIATFGADVRQLVVSGDVGFAERVDHLKMRDGTLIHSAPVVSVYEFDDNGKIAAMREYFDSAGLKEMMSKLQPIRQ
jgi:limonene-1,2-epoxide hydrolase